MIWRFAAALVMLFWAVMTGLLLREVYFPAESRFAEVPARMVLDLFLEQAQIQQGMLHLYHEQEKIGHAMLQVTAHDQAGKRHSYDLTTRGVVERTQKGGARVNATWEVRGLLDVSGSWRGMEVLAALPQPKMDLTVRWKEGAELPEIRILQNGKPLVDESQFKTMLAMLKSGQNLGGAGWMAALGLGGVDLQKLNEKPEMPVEARQAMMSIAGRERACYLIRVPLPGSQEVRLLFTEIGELARIDLPQGYRLLEPMIHGLIDPLPATTKLPHD
jgi:hypothetical protein